jgi:hypothetical protein
MEYRRFGRSGLQVSAISMGTEYVFYQPPTDAIAVVREAVAQGINYFDLFWAKPEFRDTMGEAFRGLRDKVMLAGHLGATWRDGQGDKSRDLALNIQFIEDFLTRYHTDYVDVLYLHNIDEQADYDQVFTPGGPADLARRYQREGKARLIGFSGHTVSTALQAVKTGIVDVLMFPINMAGHAVPGRRELLETCAALDVAVVAMKPYAGGKLLAQERTMAMEMWQLGDKPRTIERRATITAAECLAYVLAQSGISTIVPGARTLTELAEAVGFWKTNEEQRDYAAALASFAEYTSGECCYCNHCLPCPAVIDIGQTIRLFEQAQRGLTDAQRATYAALEANAGDCLQCGSCEERCPFEVKVIEKMEQAAALFA